MGGLSGIRALAGLTGLVGGGFSWCVDSVNGSDANSGKSAGAAFQTIAALVAAGAGAGDDIGVARGSHFDEEIDLVGDNITVKAYGSGAAPLFDGGDEISGTWDDNVARGDANTNVYSISISPETVVGQSWINAWEDGAFLANVANLAACQATAGSYHVVDHDTTPQTLYVHPNGSTNPNVDDKSYVYSRRFNGCNLEGDNCIIDGVSARRNLGYNGTIRIYGTNGQILDSTAQQGGRHTLQIGAGVVRDCTVQDGYYGGAGGALIVHYLGAAAGEDVTFEDVTVTQDAGLPEAGAVGGHTGSGNYNDITFTRCTSNANTSFYSPSDVTGTVTFTDCDIYTGATTAAITRNVGFDLVISGGTLTGPYSHIRSLIGGAFTCNMSGATFTLNNGAANSVAISQVVNLIVSNCDFVLDGAVGTLKWFGISNGSSDVNIQNCRFEDVTRTYEFANGLNSLVSDYNCFNGNVNEFNLSGLLYNFAGWQGLGQDAHSTQGSCFS